MNQTPSQLLQIVKTEADNYATHNYVLAGNNENHSKLVAELSFQRGFIRAMHLLNKIAPELFASLKHDYSRKADYGNPITDYTISCAVLHGNVFETSTPSQRTETPLPNEHECFICLKKGNDLCEVAMENNFSSDIAYAHHECLAKSKEAQSSEPSLPKENVIKSEVLKSRVTNHIQSLICSIGRLDKYGEISDEQSEIIFNGTENIIETVIDFIEEPKENNDTNVCQDSSIVVSLTFAAEQKAAELVKQFSNYVSDWTTTSKPTDDYHEAVWESGMKLGRAKQCALICVEEMLSHEHPLSISAKQLREVKGYIKKL